MRHRIKKRRQYQHGRKKKKGTGSTNFKMASVPPGIWQQFQKICNLVVHYLQLQKAGSGEGRTRNCRSRFWRPNGKTGSFLWPIRTYIASIFFFLHWVLWRQSRVGMQYEGKTLSFHRSASPVHSKRWTRRQWESFFCLHGKESGEVTQRLP